MAVGKQTVRRQRVTLRDGLDLHDNGLNLLRLIFASLVIATHTPRLAGVGEEITIAHVSFGGLAVGGFFAVSGFLITRSRLHLRGGRFGLRRLARIFPGYWLCLVITAFGLAALMGTQRGGWSVVDATRYVVTGLPMLTWQTVVGGTLHGAHFTTNVNASLWTLPVELLCYLALGLTLAVPFARHRLRLVSIVGLLGATALACRAGADGGGEGFFGLAAAFGAGVVLYAWRDRVVLNGWLALVAGVAFVAAFQTSTTIALGALPYAYLCLWLGAVCPPFLRKIGATNDISYGVYLYGFPVQQTFAAFNVEKYGVVPYFLVSLLGAVLLGWFSWLAVERPVNEFVKRRTSERGRGQVPRHRRTTAVT